MLCKVPAFGGDFVVWGRDQAGAKPDMPVFYA